jgi:hypothetical protein
MPIPTDHAQLSALFAKLGARDPDGWASSQVTEGINQLHRFLFLKKAWEPVIHPTDTSWMDRLVDNAERWPQHEAYQVGRSLKRLLASGVDRTDLAEVVRTMQLEVLHGICYLLSDPSIEAPDVAEVGWALVETDADDHPTARTIDGLHESVGETDPHQQPGR